MRLSIWPLEEYRFDVLVVGGGGAACRAAIECHAQGVRVAVICKGVVARSGATPMACPSYQAAVAHQDPRDNPEIAFRDTVEEGRHLGDENLIWALTTEATERARDLEQYGLRYQEVDGHWLQVRHPGHTFPRNLVIRGCGYAMARCLKRECKRRQIPLFEDVMATRLLLHEGRVVGVVALDLRRCKPVLFLARAVILATGGYTQLWEFTDTSADLTGDGVVMAYRAGAVLVDMEMALYYPTCLTWPPEIRGTLVQHEGLVNPAYIGAPMLNGRGEPIIPADIPPVRDVLMKIMVTEILEGRGTPSGGIYIAIPKSPKSREEIFRLLKTLDSLPYKNLRDLDVDIMQQYLEVAPGIHYTLGGVRIGEQAETSLPGLYAAGEVAGNVHGANRTSGNALAETQVFGQRAGLYAAAYARTVGDVAAAAVRDQVEEEIRRINGVIDRPGGTVRPVVLKRRLKRAMDQYMGYRRSEASMREGLAEVARIRDELQRIRVHDASAYSYELREALELEGMVELAEVVLRCGLFRQESRGHHWRTDFPDQREEWTQHVVVRRTADGDMAIGTAPVIRLGQREKAAAGSEVR